MSHLEARDVLLGKVKMHKLLELNVVSGRTSEDNHDRMAIVILPFSHTTKEVVGATNLNHILAGKSRRM